MLATALMPRPTAAQHSQAVSRIHKHNNYGSCRGSASLQGPPRTTFPGRGFGFKLITARGRMRYW